MTHYTVYYFADWSIIKSRKKTLVRSMHKNLVQIFSCPYLIKRQELSELKSMQANKESQKTKSIKHKKEAKTRHLNEPKNL